MTYTKPPEVDHAWLAYLMQHRHFWSTCYLQMRRPAHCTSTGLNMIHAKLRNIQVRTS